MLPSFIVIGAQKSGSTFILNCLAEHPEIFMHHDEVRFFENPTYLENDISTLEALFYNVTIQKAVGIKRPGYLGRPECAERIYKHVPEAKLIVILRDPISRAISAYYHSMQCGFIPIKPIEEGLEKIIHYKYQGRYPQAQEIIDFGLYHKHLERYLNYFSPEKLLVLLFDDIKIAPLDTVKQIYNFLGVDETYIPQSLTTKNRQNPGVYSLTRIRFRNLRNPIVYEYYDNGTKRHRKQPTPLIKFVDKTVQGIDRSLLKPIYGNLKPKLSSPLRSSLLKLYKEDIDNLEILLNRDLSNWKLN